MTQHPGAPPRLATWLLGLVATRAQHSNILGDLQEELADLVSREGATRARRWYWGQSVRTLAHLVGGQIRRAPAAAAAFGIGGFAFYLLIERALQFTAMRAVTHSNPYAYVDGVAFWKAVDVTARYVLPVTVGWTIARAARGREVMTAVCVCAAGTIWVFSFYAIWLAANLGLVQLHLSVVLPMSVFSPGPSGPPHAASIMNTLRHFGSTVAYWWAPFVVLMFAGAALRRTTSSDPIVERETVR
jgi:hypothetical protein